jgi:hypothetical protein
MPHLSNKPLHCTLLSTRHADVPGACQSACTSGWQIGGGVVRACLWFGGEVICVLSSVESILAAGTISLAFLPFVGFVFLTVVHPLLPCESSRCR